MTRHEVTEVVLELAGSRVALRFASGPRPEPPPAGLAAWECPRCGRRDADPGPTPRCGRCGFWDTES